MPVTMTREEREQFLGGVHVGVLSVASVDGRGPLAVPVWYSYQPGGTVNVITGGSTRKAAAILAAGRFSLCAQDERPPYKYVTGIWAWRAATPTSRPTPPAARSCSV